MPRRKVSISVPGIYHLLNRGVDKRDIFLDDEDRLRFINDLYEFNDPNFDKELNRARYFLPPSGTAPLSRMVGEGRGGQLVDVMTFCLMPNHYHLLIKTDNENGLQTFITRLNKGYSQFFNRKYKRSGALFEGRYKAVPVINESHFAHIPYYIHFNPLDLIGSGWRKSEVGDVDAELRFMDSYRWSSHLDYSGIRNFPSVTNREFLLDHFGGPDGYKKSIRDWLISRRNFEWMKGMTLE